MRLSGGHSWRVRDQATNGGAGRRRADDHRTTRGLPANPERSPCVCSSVLGVLIFIFSQIISGQLLQTRSDDRPCHCAGNVTAKHAKYTKRNPRPAATDSQDSLCLSGEHNHGDTERTEKLQTCRTPQLTSELTDRRALTCQSFKTPRHQSQGQTAVRCSDLVRQSKVHHSKISGQHRPTRRDGRPIHSAPKCTHQTLKTH